MIEILRRRRALMGAQGDGIVWDYNWNDSMGTVPPNATYNSYTVTGGKYLFESFNLSLSNIPAGKNAEIVAVIDAAEFATSDTPAVGLKKYDSGKIYLKTDKSVNLAGMTASSSASATSGWHEYKVVLTGTLFEAFFDGVKIGEGTGRHSVYDKNGVVFATKAKAYIKSIKYREW